MKSLFGTEVAREYAARISTLSHTSRPAWGKMSVSQMLAHCQKPLELALGKTEIRGNALLRFLFGRSARRKILLPEPFRKNLPTFPEARISGQKEFDEEKQKLLALIFEFHRDGALRARDRAHPFFGNLSVQEWDTLMSKHLDHHLNQFNV